MSLRHPVIRHRVLFQTSLLACGAKAHCDTLQHAAIRCNTLHYPATHCNSAYDAWSSRSLSANQPLIIKLICRTRSATHCTTLQHAAKRCNTLQHNATCLRNESCEKKLLYMSSRLCIYRMAKTSPLQHTATHCNTLQHTVTRCNTNPTF